MNDEILRIEDVFQIPDRGTVVSGVRGDAWDVAKIGDSIELRTPKGERIRTAIQQLEILRRGVLSGVFPGLVAFTDTVTSEQIPRETLIVRLTHDNAAAS